MKTALSATRQLENLQELRREVDKLPSFRTNLAYWCNDAPGGKMCCGFGLAAQMVYFEFQGLYAGPGGRPMMYDLGIDDAGSTELAMVHLFGRPGNIHPSTTIFAARGEGVWDADILRWRVHQSDQELLLARLRMAIDLASKSQANVITLFPQSR